MSRYDFTGVAEWNRIPGWFDLSKAIAVQRVVKRLPAGARLVELGSFQGRSSVAIAAVLPPGARLYCVDHFQGSPEHQTMKLDLGSLRQAFDRHMVEFGVQDRVEVMALSTREAAARFQPDSLDFVLLDAAHDFDSVHADLIDWYPKLKPGACLVCDDYEPAWPGVMQAVQALALEGKLIARALWLHRRPSTAEPPNREPVGR
jgi:predicted O-methyltransferase YrrM